jgi:hypothetical protein
MRMAAGLPLDPDPASRRRLSAVMAWTRQHIVHAVALTVAVSFLTEVVREVVLGEISMVTRALVGADGASFLRSVGTATRQQPDRAWSIAEGLVIAMLVVALVVAAHRARDQRRQLEARLARVETDLLGLDEELKRESEFRLAIVAMENGWKWTLAVNSGLSDEATKAELVSWVLQAGDEVLKGGSRPRLRVAYLECQYKGRPDPVPVPEERHGVGLRYQLAVVGNPIRLDESAELDVRSFGNDRGIVNRAILAGEQRYCPDVTRPELPDCVGYLPSSDTSQFRSLVCQPVILRHGIRGALCVDSIAPNAFAAAELTVIEHLAGKVGLIYTLLES